MKKMVSVEWPKPMGWKKKQTEKILPIFYLDDALALILNFNHFT